MSTRPDASLTRNSALLAKYRARGLWGGLLLGALLGVAVAGPKMHAPTFSALYVVGWVLGGAFVLGLVGYLFVEIFIARLMAEPGASIASGFSSGTGSDGGGDSGGGGDAGGGGGGDS